MFNKDLYLAAYGNIYSNQGAMTPGPSQETADGMSEDKIDQIIGRCGTSGTGSPRPAASTSRRRTGSSARSACQRRRHSAVASREPSGSVLITHPFHPLSGQRLEVLFAKRRAGAVVLVGESAELGRVTVQESWTERGPAPLGCRVSVEGLAALDTLIRSLQGR